MVIETPPHFRLNITLAGQQISEQFRTVQEAMTAAEDYDKPAGEVLYYAPGSEPVQVIVYNPDGSIAVGADVPDDDFEDKPWTEAEIAKNRRRSRGG